VSYAIENEAGTFFHGGDTRHDEATLAPIGERRTIDLAALAFGTDGVMIDKHTRELTRKNWYSDGPEVVEAAGALRADRLLPTHWDMWRGLTADPAELVAHARGVDHPARVVIAEIGDRVDV
jgi:L-ascorbate 6-phosphate lactonase